jgi:hypothetical protein
MVQLEVNRDRGHMDQASKVLAEVGTEASRDETWVDGSLDVVGVEVQTRQKRSFQVRRIDLEHYRLDVVVRNVQIQQNHSRIPGKENYWIHQYTFELGMHRRVQGSNCGESGTGLRAILPWRQWPGRMTRLRVQKEWRRVLAREWARRG